MSKRWDLVLEDMVGDFVMPGDEFSYESFSSASSKVTLGPGLKLLPSCPDGSGSRQGRVVACKAGIVRKVKGNVFFIEFKSNQYDVCKKDDVLGVIKQKGKGDQYSCDVSMKERAQLSKFAFEGATKRYRPDLQVGDVVYGKVVDLPSDYPIEITCVHSTGKAQGLGLLEGGQLFQVPVHFTRILRCPDDSINVLKKLGKMLPFEVAVGVNGLVWLKAKNSVHTILLAQAVQKLSKLHLSQHDAILKEFSKGLSNV